MTGPEPVVVRPVRLARVCRVAAVLVVLVFTVVALSLRRGGDADLFGVVDQVAMVVLGLLVALVVLAFTRARVVADASAIRVRNVFGEKSLPWQVVREVRLDEGASWASLELQDDDTVALLAVQANDKERAVRAVLALRALLAESRSR